ncbi:MAG TPA: single-stranded-DNA-specific exonuclease RecJ [Niabella sp.]|nr:single-stranded-DNA-specific exonuclease RecJ [Niabella sp.]HQW16449.1 single-stranded-DNA-specific exonuclease RecJ [Niabella sp.]HQX21689.1 single-stranded-DNA-specific exonuclease RecJ [Niabella sp.]HQX42710.1 single-stranded-DNA-specific exonuclease RecJ [Niabella sp.]HRB36591.1 single-stranded-DNA-specific exonuclease RecJ [Niabella sp.]
MIEKRWNLFKNNEDTVKSLQESLKINRIICEILVQRGLTTFEDARDFFRPTLDQLYSPWLMKDMKKAVTRILEAFKNNERILVFGDYDVDGTTSVACMYGFLKSQHEHVSFYIPHRYKEGYGVSKAGIDFAKEHQHALIISLDCGIKSVDLVNYANSLNIDFIICDHHLPDEIIPDAVAVLNPKQKDCSYPFKELCGCGVGFKLISALCESLNLSAETAYEYLDLVATAIAADIVPIADENRILAFYGLKKVNENPNFGIKALATLSSAKLPMSINNLVFMIAPRVNAAGRMDDASKAVRLFIANTDEEALQYAELLHIDNKERKEADSNITSEALEMISQETDWKENKSTVVYQPHWHKGVVGIVASRLIEHYYRPTIVLTESGDYAAGSARSVPGFNLYEAIHACREYLIGYGGHFAAAGLTLEKQNLIHFRNRFEEVVSSTIDPELLIPEIKIDAVIKLSDITQPFFNILKQMEPFGPENMRPVFIAQNVVDTGFSKIVKENHLRVVVKQGDKTITGIGFNMADKFTIVESGKPFDIVFKIEENEWNGQISLQLKIEDIRTSPI